MARFTITLDVPDERQAEIIAAMRHHFGQVGNPPRDRTAQELIAGVKAETVQMMKGWYREWWKTQRDNADIEIT